MKYARKCDECGCGMNNGFLFEDGGAYYCSDACLYTDGYTKKDFEEDYKNDGVYWTEWEELDSDGYYTQGGDWVDTEEYNGHCPNCGENENIDYDTDKLGASGMPTIDCQDLKCDDCGHEFTIEATWKIL